MKKLVTYMIIFFVLEALMWSIFKPVDLFDKTLGVVAITLYLFALREIKYLSCTAKESATMYFCISAIAFVAAAMALSDAGKTGYVAMCVLLGIIFFSAFIHMRYSLMATLTAGSLAFFLDLLTIELLLKNLLIGLIITLLAVGFKFFITTDWRIPKDQGKGPISY